MRTAIGRSAARRCSSRWSGRAEGWIRPLGGDLSRPLAQARNSAAQPHGAPLSDDFSRQSVRHPMGFLRSRPATRWIGFAIGTARCTCAARDGARATARRSAASAATRATGSKRRSRSIPAPKRGLLLFYNRRLYAGLGIGDNGLVMHRYGLAARHGPARAHGGNLRIRLANERNILTLHTSADRRRDLAQVRRPDGSVRLSSQCRL